MRLSTEDYDGPPITPIEPDPVEDRVLIKRYEAYCEEQEQLEKDGIILEDPAFELVTREEWGALPPKKPLTKNEHPLEAAVVSFTVDILPTEDSYLCRKAMRALQRYHMKKGASDIVYNFVSCGDGKVYEGRGFHKEYSEFWNYPSEYGTCLVIGVFGKRDDAIADDWDPPEGLLLPVAKLLNYAEHNNYIEDRENVYEDHENCFPYEELGMRADQVFPRSYYDISQPKKVEKVEEEYPDLDTYLKETQNIPLPP